MDFIFQKMSEIALLKRCTQSDAYCIKPDQIDLHVYMSTNIGNSNPIYASLDASLLPASKSYIQISLHVPHDGLNVAMIALLLNSDVFKAHMESMPSTKMRTIVSFDLLNDFKIPIFIDQSTFSHLAYLEFILEYLRRHIDDVSVEYAQFKLSIFELLREAIVWSIYCPTVMEKHGLHILENWQMLVDNYAYSPDLESYMNNIFDRLLKQDIPLMSEMQMIPYMRPELKASYMFGI